MSDDLDALDELAVINTPSATPGRGEGGVDRTEWAVSELADLPRAVRGRVLRRWLLPACGDQLSADTARAR